MSERKASLGLFPFGLSFERAVAQDSRLPIGISIKAKSSGFISSHSSEKTLGKGGRRSLDHPIFNAKSFFSILPDATSVIGYWYEIFLGPDRKNDRRQEQEHPTAARTTPKKRHLWELGNPSRSLRF